MTCAVCASANQVEFPTEMAIHLPGRKNLDKPHVFVFPKIRVCLDCGLSTFIVLEAELQELRAEHEGSKTAQ